MCSLCVLAVCCAFGGGGGLVFVQVQLDLVSSWHLTPCVVVPTCAVGFDADGDTVYVHDPGFDRDSYSYTKVSSTHSDPVHYRSSGHCVRRHFSPLSTGLFPCVSIVAAFVLLAQLRSVCSFV